jgi:hypothetical protein
MLGNGFLIVLYDAKNNKKFPGNSTSLPREAGQERTCVHTAAPGPPPLPRQARHDSGRRPASRTDFHHQKGVLP